MGEFDPVSWEPIEAATGPPAGPLVARVDRLADDLPTDDYSAAVKAVHDALAGDDVERTVPGLGDPFVTGYLLERGGLVQPADAPPEYVSLVERRPSDTVGQSISQVPFFESASIERISRRAAIRG